MLFPAVSPRSVGFSKSGALWKTSAPVLVLMENFAESSPPLRDHVTVSLAVNVWMAFVFSAIVFAEVASPALPEGPLMSGLVSSTSVTVMVEVAVDESLSPSLMTQEMVRLAVLGLSEVLLYVTDSRAASYCALVAVPVRVRTPMDGFQEPVMSVASVNARTSAADWKPEDMVMVADSMLVSSASVMVREASITVAPSPSV